MPGGRLQMSLLTASRHKAAACSDGTHPDQEVTAPEAFGLWCKRRRLLEHGSETSPEHRLSFHLLAQLPAAAGTCWLAAVRGRPEHIATFSTAGNKWFSVESILLTLLSCKGKFFRKENSCHAAPLALRWQQVEVCAQ